MTSAILGPNAMSMAMGASSTSPGQSSPESFEIEEDSNAAQPVQWPGTEQTSPTSGSQPPRVPAPLQKRRRVTRACDECRRKKIKCDGKQPCTHCTVYSYDCTYDQPSNRRRNPAPQYIEALESRLQRAETLLKTVFPNVDLNDPNIDALIQQGRQIGNNKDVSQSNAAGKSGDGSDSSEHDAHLRSMIESTGQLDLDETGHWDFHGRSSGTVFVRRMREQFGGLLGNDYSAPLFPRIPRPNVMTPNFESPRSSTESPMDTGLLNTTDLPSRENARALCEDSLNSASSLLRFIHQPTFYEMFDRIYDNQPEDFGDYENRFLPLLYMTLALGCMFHLEPGEDPKNPVQNTYKAGIDQGLKYFRAARNMMDITDCRDITSLQAILFMILFLQSSANLSTCYSYIGIALRSALRMGLHRSLLNNFNPVERETRRRVFWVIRKMDTYVSALLGFPQMLSNDDIDQELPIEVDDEYITKDGIRENPPPSLLFQASNAHTRLMSTLAKVIKYIYPTKGLEQSLQGNVKASYGISHAKIREIERDLAAWLDKLPMALRPGGEGPPEILRVQQLLRLSYAHVQMMLYRPFLHYVSEKAYVSKQIDERAYACAAASVSVSRNIVHITTEMKKRGLLVGAYWFTMYTTFFAILSLVYFVLENPDKPGSQEILSDANDGKDALNGLARRSQAADRCSAALKGLFERLPERLKDSRPGSAIPKKKRSAPSPAGPRAVSSPDPSQIRAGLSRATTFPAPSPLQTSNLQRSSLDGNRFPNTLSIPNFRQSVMSPTVGTPDSGSTNNSIQQPHFPMQQSQFGINTAVPDLSAMMFPSADPFAYPNQPMAAFDNIKQDNISIMSNSQIPPLFLSNSTPTPSSGRYDDLEGQLFGPLPPYLTQGQPNYDLNPHIGTVPGIIGGLGQDMNYHTGVTPSNEMAGNFDGFFSGDGDEWSNNITDQRFG